MGQKGRGMARACSEAFCQIRGLVLPVGTSLASCWQTWKSCSEEAVAQPHPSLRVFVCASPVPSEPLPMLFPLLCPRGQGRSTWLLGVDLGGLRDHGGECDPGIWFLDLSLCIPAVWS